MAVDEMKDPARIPPRNNSHLGAPPASKLILPILLVVVAAGCLVGCWRWMGTPGLAGSAVGLGIGALISTISQRLRGNVRRVTGPRMVSALMASVLASFGLFLAAILILGLLWKDAVRPAICTALLIYLTVSYHDAFSRRFAGTGRS
jgi:hypothetical protein